MEYRSAPVELWISHMGTSQSPGSDSEVEQLLPKLAQFCRGKGR